MLMIYFWKCRIPIVLLAVLLPMTAIAHHAFDAEFSRDLPIELEGTVTHIQWSNPHARVYIDVVDGQEGIVNWNLELASPNMYMRQGWGKDTLQVGEKVTVTGWRARNEPYVGNVGTIKKADGQELFSRGGRNN